MNAERRELLRLYDGLDAAGRRSLVDYAGFLTGRAGAVEEAPVGEPRPLPRPEEESVVAAIRRLRATYPMLDATRLLDDVASSMAGHVLRGRAAGEVIDELEALFRDAYARHAGEREEGA